MKHSITIAAILMASACATSERTCERIEGFSKEGVPIIIGEPCLITPAPERIAVVPDSDRDRETPIVIGNPVIEHEPPIDPKPKDPRLPGGGPHVNPMDPEYNPGGNPGNDKPVGQSGEKPDKDMNENGDTGNRGRSN